MPCRFLPNFTAVVTAASRLDAGSNGPREGDADDDPDDWEAVPIIASTVSRDDEPTKWRAFIGRVPWIQIAILAALCFLLV